jgi:DNA gyrase/topoisomerase IV subunit A
LSAFAWECLLEDSEIWKTTPNYDGSLQEPVELNVRVPALLLNGQEGIGVGYTCKIAPHNLQSVCKGLEIFLKDRKKIKNVQGELTPDFPTGCDIVDDEELAKYRETGKGNIRCRAKVSAGTQKREGRAKDRPTLTFTNLPPGVNPEKLGEQIRDLIEQGKIDGITEIINVTDRSGDRLTVVGKVDCGLDGLSKQLFHYTDLELNFSARTLVIDGFKPVELNPSQVLEKWAQWRLAVLEGKFSHELRLAQDRLHIVEGLTKAISKIDSIIKLIRGSGSRAEALLKLVDKPHKFTKAQAGAILDMRLSQLTNLDSDSLSQEQAVLNEKIAGLTELIKSEASRVSYLLKEIKNLAKKYGVPRRSELIAVPEGFSPGATPKAKAAAPRPRFLKIDKKRGVVEQVKGPRGAMVADHSEKLVFLSADGLYRKLPSKFKGPVSHGYCELSLAQREAEVSQKKFLTVFELEGEVRAMVIEGQELCRCTSRAKRWLPEGAELVHFGEAPYTVLWAPKRKRPTVLDLATKVCKPGSRGLKIGLSQDRGAWNGTNVPIG